MSKIVLASKPSITVEIAGVEYPVRRPTLGEMKALEDRFFESKANGGVGGSSILIETLVACGLPFDVAGSLDSDDAEAIIEGLKQPKKA